MLMKVATDHGNYANRKRKCGEIQKNGPQSFRCSEFHQNLCEKLIKRSSRPGRVTLSGNVGGQPNVYNVHAKSVRDR